MLFRSVVKVDVDANPGLATRCWRAVDPIASRDPRRATDRPSCRRASSRCAGTAIAASARRLIVDSPRPSANAASLQTRSCSSRASTRSATRLRGLQRIRADSPAAIGCSWANPIRKPAPPAGRIVTTGSSPRPSPAGLVGTIALEESIVAQLERFGPSRLLNFGESTRSPRPRSSSVQACGMSPLRSHVGSLR